ncbi:MAG: adenylate/guanylate cyclase domain-containing protein [Polyangiaceae bacterium]
MHRPYRLSRACSSRRCSNQNNDWMYAAPMGDLSPGVHRQNASSEPSDSDGPARHPITGAFLDAALETRFLHEQFDLADGRFVRNAIVVSTGVFLLYALHDLHVIPEVSSTALKIRFGVFAPLASICVALVFSRWFEKLHQAVSIAFGTIATTTVLLVGAISPSEAFYPYTTYATIFVTMGPFLLKMSVPAQLAYIVISLIDFNVIHGLIPNEPPHVVFSINFSLVSMGLLGAFIAYAQGRDARTSFLQRRTIAQQVEIIGTEREKAERLLLNILPAPIADRLKTEHRAIADGFAEVTVLFSDIVGFTKMSERVTPAELVGRLNALFSAFDDAAVELGLEKIKTIGDAYMVVGGLPSPHDDQAGAIAEMALRMQQIVRDNAREHGDALDVRIGVHTGPVVAGVIGKRKFVYDVWGDTVNTASRMESHSEPGRIQVTAAAAAKLGNRFKLVPRGVIEVKGKGPMETYFLERLS